jgi:hypothetical protein
MRLRDEDVHGVTAVVSVQLVLSSTLSIL